MPPLEVSISYAPKCRVKDHPKMKAGYKSRLWCSQDAERRKKSKVNELLDLKNRYTVGMHRYDCNGSWNDVTCFCLVDGTGGEQGHLLSTVGCSKINIILYVCNHNSLVTQEHSTVCLSVERLIVIARRLSADVKNHICLIAAPCTLYTVQPPRILPTYPSLNPYFPLPS
jgi:hypothetical protein